MDCEGQFQPTKFRKQHAYDQRYVSSVNTDIYSDDFDSGISNSFTCTSSDPPFVSMSESEANDFASMLEAKAEH